MEILQLKNTITTIKNSVNGLNSRLEITREISKFENKKLPTFNNREANTWIKNE